MKRDMNVPCLNCKYLETIKLAMKLVRLKSQRRATIRSARRNDSLPTPPMSSLSLLGLSYLENLALKPPPIMTSIK